MATDTAVARGFGANLRQLRGQVDLSQSNAATPRARSSG